MLTYVMNRRHGKVIGQRWDGSNGPLRVFFRKLDFKLERQSDLTALPWKPVIPRQLPRVVFVLEKRHFGWCPGREHEELRALVLQVRVSSAGLVSWTGGGGGGG